MPEDPLHPDDPILLACRELARAMDLFDESACRRLGIGRSDLRALNALEHGPLSPAEIATALGLTRAAVTALVDRLEGAGYVARSADPYDRRALRVALQPATFRAFAEVYRPLGVKVHGVARALPARDRRVVVESMHAMALVFDAARTGR